MKLLVLVLVVPVVLVDGFLRNEDNWYRHRERWKGKQKAEAPIGVNVDWGKLSRSLKEIVSENYDHKKEESRSTKTDKMDALRNWRLDRGANSISSIVSNDVVVGEPMGLPRDLRSKDADKINRKLKLEKESSRILDKRCLGQDAIDDDKEDYPVDVHSGSVLTGAKLLASLDTSVCPCEDFYQFVCGKWIETESIPQTLNHYSQFTKTTEHVEKSVENIIDGISADGSTKSELDIAKYYLSCYDETVQHKLNLSPLTNILSQFDLTIPMLDDFPTEESLDLHATVKKQLVNFMADTGLFGLDMMSDPENAQGNTILVAYQPSVARTAFLDDVSAANKESNQFYKDYLYSIGKLIRNYIAEEVQDQPSTDQAVMAKAVEDMVQFEKSILLIKVDTDSLTDEQMKERRTPMTMKEFREMLKLKPDSKLDFSALAKESMKELTGQELTDDTRMIVLYKDYFSRITELIDSTPNEVLLNYLVFRTMMDHYSETTRQMKDIHQIMVEVLTGIKVPTPREKTCVRATVKYFGNKLSDMYVKADNALGEKRQKILQMAQELKDSFKKLVQEDNDWMDEETKSAALEKLDAMALDVIYPPERKRMTQEQLEQFYADVDVDVYKYVDNRIHLEQFWTSVLMNKLGKVPQFVDQTDMDFDETMVNAFYAMDFNGMVIPDGILHFPFYLDERLSTLNYGSVAAIIGHEMTHGFDNHGSNYDKEGNVKDWWSSETRKAFEERMQCFVDQYNRYSFPALKNIPSYTGPSSVNGERTLGENIADNGGLRQAYYAYKAATENLPKAELEKSLPGLPGLDQDQLFFVSYAHLWCEVNTFQSLASKLVGDVHAPAAARVRGTMENSPEFAKAFKCKTGKDEMAPKDRCMLW